MMKLATVITVLATPAFAQPTTLEAFQANNIMRGCRQAIIEESRAETFLGGVCMGIVGTIAFAGKPGVLGIAPSDRFCLPAGVNTGQAVRVAVAYIDARPARLHEQFSDLAVEAFREAWPCR